MGSWNKCIVCKWVRSRAGQNAKCADGEAGRPTDGQSTTERDVKRPDAGEENAGAQPEDKLQENGGNVPPAAQESALLAERDAPKGECMQRAAENGENAQRTAGQKEKRANGPLGERESGGAASPASELPAAASGAYGPYNPPLGENGRKAMNIDVLTLFPEMFHSVIGSSILGRAVEKGLLKLQFTDIRAFSHDKHNKADDYPFGGGGGMVMMADPIFGALQSVDAAEKKIVYMSPRGKILDAEKIKELAKLDSFVILCGHYEGVDQRALDYWDIEEVSIGDYVLTGGELPAMVLIDSVARMLPGVLGNEHSALDESIYSGLLEHPQYTKPREYCGMQVPEVLVSGNHKLIALWRFREALLLTKQRRPDLYDQFIQDKSRFSKDEAKIVEEIEKIRT